MAVVRALLGSPSRARHAPRILAFDGMPGIGKSALAIRVAHELAADYPDGQLYLNLHGFRASSRPVAVEEALRDLISGLGAGPGRIPAGRQAMAGLYRTLLHDRRVLVVLDDARDAEQLTDLLPSSRDCLAVVTSRRRMTALRTSAGAGLVSLPLPDREEARAFLLEHLGGRPGVAATVLDALIDDCGRLPLALAVAGAHAAASADPPRAEMLGEFRHVASAGVRDAFYGSYRRSRPACCWTSCTRPGCCSSAIRGGTAGIAWSTLSRLSCTTSWTARPARWPACGTNEPPAPRGVPGADPARGAGGGP
jgi:NB-ARC domain